MDWLWRSITFTCKNLILGQTQSVAPRGEENDHCLSPTMATEQGNAVKGDWQGPRVGIYIKSSLSHPICVSYDHCYSSDLHFQMWLRFYVIYIAPYYHPKPNIVISIPKWHILMWHITQNGGLSQNSLEYNFRPLEVIYDPDCFRCFVCFFFCLFVFGVCVL